jgi:DNA-binding transcriptional LysR family regulator
LQYPGIDIALEIANTEGIQRHLLEGTLDLGLTEGFMVSEELVVEVFMEDELVAITAFDI